MTGKELHNRLKTILIDGEKINFTRLAEKLGMKTAQALNSRFKAQNIHEYFIRDIAQHLSIPVEKLLSKSPEISTTKANPEALQREVSERILSNGKEVSKEFAGEDISQLSIKEMEALTAYTKALEELATLAKERSVRYHTKKN